MRGPVYFLTFKSYYSYYHAELPAFRAELARRYNDERLNKNMSPTEAEILYQEYFAKGSVCSKEEMEALFLKHMEWLSVKDR